MSIYVQSTLKFSLLATCLLSTQVFAEEIANTDIPVVKDLTDNREIITNLPQITVPTIPETKETLPTELPNETEESSVQSVVEKLTPNQIPTKEEAIAYFKENPADLEPVLQQLIRQVNAPVLEQLLPIYATYPNRDESIIMWGNAIITGSKGNLKESIKQFRELNALLPNIRLLRFQMAQALYMNKQYVAAKSELQRLRASVTNEREIQVINQYIEAIDKQQEWNVNFRFNFLNDKNLSNAPKVGTSLGNLSMNNPHQEGQGIGYGINADKKWLFENQYFTSVHLGLNGDYYWNNKKFNDLNFTAGAGIGYQGISTEIEIYPSISQRLYGGGSSGTETLKNYSNTKAMNLEFSQWLNQRWLYQNFSQYGLVRYENPYENNNNNYVLTSNTLMYMPTQNRYYFGGIDYMDSDNKRGNDDDSFKRVGFKLGWGQTWKNGISSTINVGYAKRDYQAEQFFTNIKRENKEYNLGLSLWKRDLSIMGLTPRLSWSYKDVTSNSPFEEYSKHSVDVIFTKSF